MTAAHLAPTAATFPVLFDPAMPADGAWMVLPLALLRRLPARQGTGPVAFLGLAEQLAAEAAPAARMGLRLAYVPANSVGHAVATLPLRVVALPAPGCGRRLRHLPRLDATVVRFGFPGICLTLADGRSGRVTGQRERLREEALQVEAEGGMLEIPLRRFGLLVRNWHGPVGTPSVALQCHAKNY